MVPNGWTNRKLPEFAWFQEGPGLRKWQFTDSGCKVINITNIVNGYLELKKTERHISQEELNEKYKHFLCDAGDIVIASSGNSYCKHGIVRKQDLPLVMNTSVIRFKPLENCDYEFLNQFLKSKYLKQQIDILITGGAQPNFGPAHLKQVELNLPPLPEQRKIAQILSTWDRGIATTEKLIDVSKQQKKALMQQLLTGKKRLVEPETGKAFEGEWEEVKLANICNKITDGAHHSPASVEEGFPMYSVKDMGKSGFKKGTARLISKEDYLYLEKQNCKPLINDILIAKDGSILKHCFVMEKQCDGVILSSIAILRPDLKKINPAFVAHFLSQDYVKKYVAKVFTTGSGVPRIVLKDFKSIKLKLGALAEQQKIASVLTAADKEIELLEAKLAHLKQEKKALMQQLLTGKRRVSLSS